MAVTNRLFAQDNEHGALPVLFAATQDVPGMSFIGPDGFSEMRGFPSFASRSSAAKDEQMAGRLWQRSEELTGVRFALPATVPG